MRQKLPQFLWRYRFLITLIALLLFLPMVYLYFDLDTDNSVDIWYDDTNPQKIIYNHFTEIFEGDEIIVVAFRDPKIFSPKGLALVHGLTQKLRDIPHLLSIRSITDSERMLTTSEEDLEILTLAEQFPPPKENADFKLSSEELQKIQQEMTQNPLYEGKIVSKDGFIAAIILQIARIPTSEKGDIVAKVRTIVESTEKDIEFHLSGSPVLDSEFNILSQKDHRTFTWISFGMLFLFLLSLFRRLTFAFFPLVVVISTSMITMGIYSIFGLTINVISNILAPLLLTIGMADSVHILTHFNYCRHQKIPRLEAAKKTLLEMFWPCFLTSVTTGLGFASFLSSEVVPIKNLGFFAAIGIGFAFILSLTIIPWFLSTPHIPLKDKTTGQYDQNRFLAKFLEKTARFTITHPQKIILFTFFLLVVALLGFRHLTIDNMPLEFFKKDNRARVDADFINHNLAGVSNVEMFLKGKPEDFKDPKILNAMAQTQAYGEKNTRITGTDSIVPYIRELHRVFQSGQKSDYRLPETRAATAQLLLLYELGNAEELYRMVNHDFSATRITFHLIHSHSSISAEIMNQLTLHLNEELRKIGRSDIQVQPTGIVPLYIQLDEILLRSQIQSMLTAFITVFLCMWFLLRKFKLSVIAMIPNILPIALTLGFMGYVKINLDVATVMIGSIALGIAVDDTIHFLVTFKREIKEIKKNHPSWSEDQIFPQAITQAVRKVGPAIVFTSVILFGAFVILSLGNYVPLINFGKLTSLTMIFALLGDLILLPALILVLRKPLKESF